MIITKINQVENTEKSAGIYVNVPDGNGVFVETNIGSMSGRYGTYSLFPTFTCVIKDLTNVDKADILKEYLRFIHQTLVEIGLPDTVRIIEDELIETNDGSEEDEEYTEDENTEIPEE